MGIFWCKALPASLNRNIGGKENVHDYTKWHIPVYEYMWVRVKIIRAPKYRYMLRSSIQMKNIYIYVCICLGCIYKWVLVVYVIDGICVPVKTKLWLFQDFLLYCTTSIFWVLAFSKFNFTNLPSLHIIHICIKYMVDCPLSLCWIEWPWNKLAIMHVHCHFHRLSTSTNQNHCGTLTYASGKTDLLRRIGYRSFISSALKSVSSASCVNTSLSIITTIYYHQQMLLFCAKGIHSTWQIYIYK